MSYTDFTKKYTVAIGSASYAVLFLLYITSFQVERECNYIPQLGRALCRTTSGKNEVTIQFFSGLWGVPVFIIAGGIVAVGTYLLLKELYREDNNQW